MEFKVSFLHARTKNKIRDGLMYRKKKLKKNQGMLFHTGLKVSIFWMKNTFIPLDVLFLNKKGKIIGYKEKNKPHSLKSISIGKRSFYVLEMNAGWVKKNKVKVGDKIKIRKRRKRRKTRKKRGGEGIMLTDLKKDTDYLIALWPNMVTYTPAKLEKIENIGEGGNKKYIFTNGISITTLDDPFGYKIREPFGDITAKESSKENVFFDDGLSSTVILPGNMEGGKRRRKTRKKRGGVKSAAPKKPTDQQKKSWKKLHDKNFKPKKYKSTKEMIMMGVNRRLQQQDEGKVANILAGLNIQNTQGGRPLIKHPDDNEEYEG